MVKLCGCYMRLQMRCSGYWVLACKMVFLRRGYLATWCCDAGLRWCENKLYNLMLRLALVSKGRDLIGGFDGGGNGEK
jgi:hypothetical protein